MKRSAFALPIFSVALFATVLLVAAEESEQRRHHPLVVPAHTSGAALQFDSDKERVDVQDCTPCHDVGEQGFVGDDQEHFLNRRLQQRFDDWRTELKVEVKCGSCHTLVEPDAIPARRWADAMDHMRNTVFVGKGWPTEYSDSVWLELSHYYGTSSTGVEKLPPDPTPSGYRFEARQIGEIAPEGMRPTIGNVSIVDLNQNGDPDILATDMKSNEVLWLHKVGGAWKEKALASARVPAKTEVFDFEGDGDLDIVLASLGRLPPTDKRVGAAYLLLNDDSLNFTNQRLLDDVGRLADIRPADFDNDGDIDFVVAVFGFLKNGEIGWIEQLDSMQFAYHTLLPKAGGIHVIPTHLNDDGLLDFVALVSQEYEEVYGFVNRGDSGVGVEKFRGHVLFKAFAPTFGFSGIDLVDLDGDGDQDILATNGDAIDLPEPMILPYHGVRWLENKGDLTYEHHSIFDFYGAYDAVPVDFDEDGDIDIVATSMFNDWGDRKRQSIIYLENDGDQNFAPHGFGNDYTYLICVDVADLDGDGDNDLVTAGLNYFFEPYSRYGRIVLWQNSGTIGE